jgi:hypothetical protein
MKPLQAATTKDIDSLATLHMLNIVKVYLHVNDQCFPSGASSVLFVTAVKLGHDIYSLVMLVVPNMIQQKKESGSTEYCCRLCN